MRLEIPVFTRCCGCFPLRRGIITLAYLSLALAVCFLLLEIVLHRDWAELTLVLYRGSNFAAEEWLPVLLYCIEIAFILVLLVGAHMERPMLLRVYYYYGITTTVAAFAVYLWTLFRGDLYIYTVSEFHYFYLLVDLCTIFIGIVTQAYLLLLIRSHLQKPQESLRFVNHLAEVCVQPVHGNISVL